MVAGYCGDEFEAAYHYVRALCAQEPFPARENLLNLYERNRAAVQALYQQIANTRTDHFRSVIILSHLERFLTVALNSGPSAALPYSPKIRFLLRFTRLHAILDTRIRSA